jgi:hypothetical protein
MSTVTSSTVAPAPVGPFKSLFGRKLQFDAKGTFVSNEKSVSSRAVGASIAVTDETTNVRGVTVTLKDANGDAITYQEIFELFVFSTTGRTALATGGSTGLATDTAGLILKTVTAKLYFVVQTNASGVANFTWTDTGTESVSITVRLPNGNTVSSAAFANT